MIPKCIYCDEGRYCTTGHEEVCPYWGDERCKCLEYQPEESHYGEFGYTVKKIIEAYKDQIKELKEELADILLQVNVSREMTLQEAKRQGAKEFAEKLKKYFEGENSCVCYSDGYDAVGGSINDSIDEFLEEYEE